jgi:tRNA threonylcarbamoyladenosine biosynthesis protein TsaE
LGYTGPVKSPTYTLIEPYTLPDRRTYHLDLYRLHEPEELEYLGLRDYLTENAICLIEWPEQGITYLPPADLQIQLSYHQEQRLVKIQAHTSIGQQLLQNLKLHYAEVQNEVLNN